LYYARGVVRAQLIVIALASAAAARLATEWWHFDAPDSANYALSDEPLQDRARIQPP
jgi:D-alanyl-D-alanine dipeptidase